MHLAICTSRQTRVNFSVNDILPSFRLIFWMSTKSLETWLSSFMNKGMRLVRGYVSCLFMVQKKFEDHDQPSSNTIYFKLATTKAATLIEANYIKK